MSIQRHRLLNRYGGLVELGLRRSSAQLNRGAEERRRTPHEESHGSLPSRQATGDYGNAGAAIKLRGGRG